MNRFVSLLLVALSLAAVSLAKPAHAQWKLGQAYYKNITGSHDANTTLKTTPVGSITLTSTSTPGYNSLNAAGSYGCIVKADYIWTGDPKAPGLGFNYNDAYSISGSCTGAGSANSNVNSGFNGTTTNSPGEKYGKTATTGATIFLNLSSLSKVTRSYPLGAATSDSYGGVATGSANVTFGPPS